MKLEALIFLLLIYWITSGTSPLLSWANNLISTHKLMPNEGHDGAPKTACYIFFFKFTCFMNPVKVLGEAMSKLCCTKGHV